MSLSKDNMNTLLRTITVFIIYVFYTKVFTFILSTVGVSDSIVQMFIADLIFLFGIIVVYKDNISSGFKDFKTNYQLSKKISTIIKWVAIIFIINMIMGLLTEFLFPEVASVNDKNSEAIYSLFNISSIYTIFKTMIFAIVAEELVFKKAIRDIFNNKVLFVLVSSFIYVLMNFIYTDWAQNFIYLDMLAFFLFSVVTSLAYLKNNDNIFIVMLIKFFYNLIPLTIMIIGAGQ